MAGPPDAVGCSGRNPGHRGVPMIDQRPPRLPAQPPTISALTSVRRAPCQLSPGRGPDRLDREKVLLARALDILASDVSAEARLSGLLRLLARTVGARHAAVIADGIERRTAVAVALGEDPSRPGLAAGSTSTPRKQSRSGGRGPSADPRSSSARTSRSVSPSRSRHRPDPLAGGRSSPALRDAPDPRAPVMSSWGSSSASSRRRRPPR